MIRIAILSIFAVSLAYSAQAGPWLREKGSSFTSVAVSGSYYLDTASQTFLEYGLTDKMTVIADIGMVQARLAYPSGYATLSLRRALSAPQARSKWAYELGAGVGWIGPQRRPHLRTGLSWGRGMTLQEKSGWTTVEAAVVWDLTDALHVTKVDATVGFNFTETTAGMLQLYTAHVAGSSIATVAPSVVFSPKFTKFRVQFGTESELGRLDNSAVKIALWREY